MNKFCFPLSTEGRSFNIDGIVQPLFLIPVTCTYIDKICFLYFPPALFLPPTLVGLDCIPTWPLVWSAGRAAPSLTRFTCHTQQITCANHTRVLSFLLLPLFRRNICFWKYFKNTKVFFCCIYPKYLLSIQLCMQYTNSRTFYTKLTLFTMLDNTASGFGFDVKQF